MNARPRRSPTTTLKTLTTPTVPPNLLSFGGRVPSGPDEEGSTTRVTIAGMMSSKRRKDSASLKRSIVSSCVISRRSRDESGLTRRVDHSPLRPTYPQGFEITCGFGNACDRIAAEARGMRISVESIARTRTALGSARSIPDRFRELPKTLPYRREKRLSARGSGVHGGSDRTCRQSAIKLD